MVWYGAFWVCCFVRFMRRMDCSSAVIILGELVNTGRPLQVKYWGVATPATPAALTPMVVRQYLKCGVLYLSTAGERSSTTVRRLSIATLSRTTLMACAAVDAGVTNRCRVDTCHTDARQICSVEPRTSALDTTLPATRVSVAFLRIRYISAEQLRLKIPNFVHGRPRGVSAL